MTTRRDDPWSRHRADQERQWARHATPAQRFAWLQRAWLFLWKARRGRTRPAFLDPSSPD